MALMKLITKFLPKRFFPFSNINKRINKVACLYKDKKKKKLHLVLDLDHTLLHSGYITELSQGEKYLIQEVDTRADLWRSDNEFFIKLRPFVRKFLREANKLFHMHVYTMGTYDYAQTVLKLIDPKKVYFGDRIITREISPYEKTLDLVSADQRRVVIVDDSSCVWPHHKRNLLTIRKYMYFRGEYKSKMKSYAEKKRDESRSKGALANVLKVLQKAHKRYEEELDFKDLRMLIH